MKNTDVFSKILNTREHCQSAQKVGTILQLSIFCFFFYYLATQAGKAQVPVKGGVEKTEGRTQKGCTFNCKSLDEGKIKYSPQRFSKICRYWNLRYISIKASFISLNSRESKKEENLRKLLLSIFVFSKFQNFLPGPSIGWAYLPPPYQGDTSWGWVGPKGRHAITSREQPIGPERMYRRSSFLGRPEI